MAETWINGFFFEYDSSIADTGSAKGLQYGVFTDMASEPVTPEFFKLHAKIDPDMDDSLVESYIKAGRQELERFSQLSLGDKVMRLRALELPKEYRLMYGPVKSIVLPLETFTLLGDIITSEEIQKNIEIRYEVGWGSVGLPESIKIAICQMGAGLYYNREDIRSDVDYSKMISQARKTVSLFKNAYFL